MIAASRCSAAVARSCSRCGRAGYPDHVSPAGTLPNTPAWPRACCPRRRRCVRPARPVHPSARHLRCARNPRCRPATRESIRVRCARCAQSARGCPSSSPRRSTCRRCCRGRRSCSRRFPRRCPSTQRPTCGMRCAAPLRGTQPKPSRPTRAPACSTTRDPNLDVWIAGAVRVQSRIRTKYAAIAHNRVRADPDAIAEHNVVADHRKRIDGDVRAEHGPLANDRSAVHASSPRLQRDERAATRKAARPWACRRPRARQVIPAHRETPFP